MLRIPPTDDERERADGTIEIPDEAAHVVALRSVQAPASEHDEQDVRTYVDGDELPLDAGIEVAKSRPEAVVVLDEDGERIAAGHASPPDVTIPLRRWDRGKGYTPDAGEGGAP